MRTLAGVDENSLVVMVAEKGKIVIKPLRVLRVKASREARRRLEEALREELVLEEKEAERLAERE